MVKLLGLDYWHNWFEPVYMYTAQEQVAESRPQTHKWVCDICLKPITKHKTSILYNYTNTGYI